MSNQANTIYQSGQTVSVTGFYEVVGTNRQAKTRTGEFAFRQLTVGEQFPCYNGRSVAWHIVTMEEEQPAILVPESNTPSGT